MSVRHIAVAVGLAVGLALVPPAAGAQATVSGTATLSGSGTSYTLRLTNTGSEPIRCWRLTLPAGVQAVSIGRPPNDWQVGAPGPPPQPVLGGQGGAGIPPGASADFPFTTDTGFPAGLAAALRISGDCKTDTDAAVTGPAAGTSPPPATNAPKPKPCACTSLTARINPRTFEYVRRLSKVALQLKLDIDWTMKCTGGAGRCSGRVEVDPLNHGTLRPKDGLVQCAGKCAKTTRGYQRFLVIDDRLAYGVRGDPFFGKHLFKTELRLVVRARCGAKKPLTRVLRVTFDHETGLVDWETSDLDGDGREDLTGAKVRSGR